MIIRCMTNTGDALPVSAYDSNQGVTAETEFAVTPGRTYPVFAVTVLLGIAWYYVLDDDGHNWPTWVPAPLFDVVDGSVPDSWMFGYFRFSREDQYPVLSFPEWASDHHYYERLVEGEEEACRIFAARRTEIHNGHS